MMSSCYTIRRSTVSISCRSLQVAVLAATLVLPPLALGDQSAGSYEADARFAESAAPTIPHGIKDTANGEYCLGCHQTGLNGAPLSPHQVRLTCTQCHVPVNPAAAPVVAKKARKQR